MLVGNEEGGVSAHKYSQYLVFYNKLKDIENKYDFTIENDISDLLDT